MLSDDHQTHGRLAKAASSARSAVARSAGVANGPSGIAPATAVATTRDAVRVVNQSCPPSAVSSSRSEINRAAAAASRGPTRARAERASASTLPPAKRNAGTGSGSEASPFDFFFVALALVSGAGVATGGLLAAMRSAARMSAGTAAATAGVDSILRTTAIAAVAATSSRASAVHVTSSSGASPA